MSDLKLDENLQPVFSEKGDYETVEGVENSEQIIRLSAKDKMFNISSRYKKENIEDKIRLAISRIADEKDFIESVQNITVENITSKEVEGSGYRVSITYNKSNNYTQIINTL